MHFLQEAASVWKLSLDEALYMQRMGRADIQL